MAHDILIIGAASADAVPAGRLSERADRSVLVLEAGPDCPSRAETPADLLDARSRAGMTHDWHDSASPVVGRSFPHRRGKVTGGTSAINASVMPVAPRVVPDLSVMMIAERVAEWLLMDEKEQRHEH